VARRRRRRAPRPATTTARHRAPGRRQGTSCHSQILSLRLDGITAGDYLTWCRDPDPPALGYALRSIRLDADPFRDTITAILDWNQPPPAPAIAATAAGLPLPPGVKIHPWPASDAPHPPDDQRFAAA
jgi:hypothetical protein